MPAILRRAMVVNGQMSNKQSRLNRLKLQPHFYPLLVLDLSSLNHTVLIKKKNQSNNKTMNTKYVIHKYMLIIPYPKVIKKKVVLRTQIIYKLSDGHDGTCLVILGFEK